MKKTLIGVVLLFSGQVLATDYTCSGNSLGGGVMTLPDTGRNITPPNTGNAGAIGGMGSECTPSTCVVLYTAMRVIPGGQVMTLNCSPAGAVFNIGYTIENRQSGITYKFGDYIIYPTSVKGIGVSVNANIQLGGNALPHWPEAIWPRSFESARYFDKSVDTWVDIRIWKTPEFTPVGNLNFTGPTFMQVLNPDSPANKITSCPGERLDDACIWLSRTVEGSVNIQSGTCNLINTSRTVTLGKYDKNIGKSPWLDASFKLQCPTAYGYNSAVTNSVNKYDVNDGAKTANRTKNNSVKIQVVPYTNVINAAQGIFSLDAGGAEGYGIQLAWGMPGEQSASDTPVKPVTFGSGTLANSLNSNFKNGPYALGGNALATGADGTIRMSARYIRTTGAVQPGPANGRVEIIAAYE